MFKLIYEKNSHWLLRDGENIHHLLSLLPLISQTENDPDVETVGTRNVSAGLAATESAPAPAATLPALDGRHRPASGP